MKPVEDFFEFIDNKVSWDIKENFAEKYGYVIDKAILVLSPQTLSVSVIPRLEYKIVKASNRSYTHEYWREFNVIWLFKYNDISVDEHVLSFEFWGIGYINVGRQYYSYEVLDPNKLLLKRLQDIRIAIYKNNDIAQVKADYSSEYFNPNLFLKYSDVCSAKNKYECIKDFNDLECISEDITSNVSYLIMYKPYVQDFLANPQYFEGEILYTYFHTFYDKQYYFIASQTIQLLYNFWDKIGDLINLFFEKINKDKNIYFPDVINKIPEECKNENYNWLSAFKDHEYKDLNKKRKQIVHYKGLESSAMNKVISNLSNREELEILQKEKMDLIPYLIDHCEKTLLGFEQALKLIEIKVSN